MFLFFHLNEFLILSLLAWSNNAAYRDIPVDIFSPVLGKWDIWHKMGLWFLRFKPAKECIPFIQSR